MTGADGGRRSLAPAFSPSSGPSPSSEWLSGCAALDERGFVLTHRALAPATSTGAGTPWAATPAVRDEPSRAVRRRRRALRFDQAVAAAVGEGSACVGAVHEYLTFSPDDLGAARRAGRRGEGELGPAEELNQVAGHRVGMRDDADVPQAGHLAVRGGRNGFGRLTGIAGRRVDVVLEGEDQAGGRAPRASGWCGPGRLTRRVPPRTGPAARGWAIPAGRPSSTARGLTTSCPGCRRWAGSAGSRWRRKRGEDVVETGQVPLDVVIAISMPSARCAPISAAERTLSGWSRAIVSAIHPPMECPAIRTAGPAEVVQQRRCRPSCRPRCRAPAARTRAPRPGCQTSPLVPPRHQGGHQTQVPGHCRLATAGDEEKWLALPDDS